MANKSILTYNARASQVEQSYYSPVAQLPAPVNQSISTIYCFLSRIDPWSDDLIPEQPLQDQKYLKTVFKNMFVVKQIKSNDISPVIERIDWETGIVYDYYKDDIDMFAADSNGFLTYHFYVRNKFDQVFKCLWNNNGAESTSEPFFEPGNYGAYNIYKGADGYKWKYMYTIDGGQKRKFMDASWIPVPMGDNNPNPVQSNPGTGLVAGSGDIEVINVVTGGSDYDPDNAEINIIITGDGTGATATAEVTGNSISDIIITNPGTNYTYANVSISSGLGSNATFEIYSSPVGGHAFHPVSELGCSRVMMVSEFNGSEGGLIPTDIDYRQVGIIINPIAQSTFNETTEVSTPANGSIYKTTTDFVVASGFGQYVADEIIYQGNSLAEASFTGHVVSFDVTTNIIKLINTIGTPTTDAPVFGNITKTARTLLTVSEPDFIPFSGYLTHIQNREAISRSYDGIEQFRFVLGF